MKRLFVLLFLILAVSSQGHAENLRFITHELKPFTWTDESSGITQGLVYDLCKETIIRMGYTQPNIEVVPFIRALNIAQSKNNIVVFHVARNAERERTLKWVGPIISNGVYFYKNKSTHFTVSSLADLKKLNHIGVGRGNASASLLQQMGFTNLYPVNNEMLAVEMLALNRVDAVPVGEMVVNELVRQANIDIKLLEKTKIKLNESVLYMGFSKNISDTEIQKWQKTFERVKDEQYEALYQHYISHQTGNGILKKP